jgi:hypothetical protein
VDNIRDNNALCGNNMDDGNACNSGGGDGMALQSKLQILWPAARLLMPFS